MARRAKPSIKPRVRCGCNNTHIISMLELLASDPASRSARRHAKLPPTLQLPHWSGRDLPPGPGHQLCAHLRRRQDVLHLPVPSQVGNLHGASARGALGAALRAAKAEAAHDSSSTRERAPCVHRRNNSVLVGAAEAAIAVEGGTVRVLQVCRASSEPSCRRSCTRIPVG
jgi:hypothetical protein